MAVIEQAVFEKGLAPVLDADGVYAILAHGRRAIRIDGAFERSDSRAVGWRDVTREDCDDHFASEKGFPLILPGGIMMEMAGQVGSLSVLFQDRFSGQVAMFSSLRNCDFTGAIVPGDRLVIEVNILSLDSRGGSASGRGFRADKPDTDVFTLEQGLFTIVSAPLLRRLTRR